MLGLRFNSVPCCIQQLLNDSKHVLFLLTSKNVVQLYTWKFQLYMRKWKTTKGNTYLCISSILFFVKVFFYIFQYTRIYM